DKVADVVKIGETVKVRVLAVKPRGTSPTDLKISLSMKSAEQPAETAAAETVLPGKVAQVTNFGVFVDTEIGRGLVPTSELGLPPNADPKRAFPVGKDVEVVVLGRGGGEGKHRFSIQGVAAAEERTAFKTFAKEAKKGAGKGLGSLGDLMKGIQAKLPDAKPSAQPRPAASGDKPPARRRA